MAKVRFLGHAAFYIEGEGIKALIDPFLTGNPQAKASPSDFTDINYIFVTHGHGDHLGDTIEIAKRTNATVISVFEIANYVQSKGVQNAHPMHIGGSYKFPFGKVKVTPALHGSGIIEGSNTLYGGNPAGFVIEVEGKKIYHAGDTGLTKDMELLADENIDIAILPIGGNFVMDVDDAVKATKMIKPQTVIPIHYDTFPVIKADPHEFEKKAKDIAKVIILKPGEETEI